MYIPIINSRCRTIINKNIVYSDTVLPLKELGENINVTKISNIGESDLEKCLKIIFESNPNVVFNTVQYSKNNKELYFYTDKPISTKKWQESKFKIEKPLNSASEILEEIKSIFLSEPNKDEENISLYEISKLLKMKGQELDAYKNSSENKMEQIIQAEYGKSSNIIIYGFDYDNDELEIGFKYVNEYKKIYFSKNNGDLYVKKSESNWSNDILVLVGNLLTELYDYYLKYKECQSQKKESIKPVNSNFHVNINKYGLCIYTKSNTNKYMHDFELSSKSYSNEYKYVCNSHNIIETIKGKEDELLKRIYVKIADCPKWSQTILTEIRKEQLAREEQKEKERIQKEAKKQKRLELKRKLFPFLK